MIGRNPTAEEKRYMDAVQQLGCIVCRLDMGIYTPASIHHIMGKTKPGAHFQILPLCFPHHQEGTNGPLFVSRHPHKKQFEARYGTEADLKEKIDELLEAQK